MLCCETCKHWRGTPSSHSADCALKVYTGLVPFNRSDPPCDKHSSTPQPTPAPDMQSQARGLPPIVQMFQPIGGKP